MSLPRVPLLVMAAILLGAACSSGSSTGPTPPGPTVTVASVEVSPTPVSLVVGATQQLTATARTAAGATVPGKTAQWSSSNPGIASVSSSGLVAGIAEGGPVTITATIDQASQGVPVTVTPKPVASVSVTPAQPTVAAGNTVQLTATPLDAQGQPLSGRAVTWQSGNTAIATVTSSGAVTGVALGSTTITATSEGQSGTAQVTVTAGPAAALEANAPVSQSVTAGAAVGTPPSVRVTDARGFAVSGVSVTFTLTAGGGTTAPASPATVQTNASGIAALTRWTTGTTAGTNTVTAAVPGLSGSPVTFTAAGTPGPAATITATSPISQSVPAGTAVTAPPSVRVTDANGNPVGGVPVLFSITAGGGATTPTSPATVTTSPNGTAMLGSWTLGSSVGFDNNSVTAATTGLTGSPVTFTASALGGPATRMVLAVPPAGVVSGVSLSPAPAVELRDANGNLSPSTALVAVAIASGSGTLAGATTATAVNGVAVFGNLRINGTGVHTLVFTSAGLPAVTSASFTVTQVAAALQVQTQPGAVIADSLFALPPAVRILDHAGLPITTGSSAALTVTASVASGNGAMAGTTTATAVAGVAAFPGLRVHGTGSHTLRFATTAPAVAVNSGAFPVAGIALHLGAAAAATAGINAEFSIPILLDLSERGGLDLAAITVTLAWDPARLAYVGNSAGTWVDRSGGTATVLVNSAAAASGTLGVTGFTTDATTANFTLRVLVLRALSTGTASVTATVSAAGDANATNVPVVVRNLTVTISP